MSLGATAGKHLQRSQTLARTTATLPNNTKPEIEKVESPEDEGCLGAMRRNLHCMNVSVLDFSSFLQ
jgi:hypothetical protein